MDATSNALLNVSPMDNLDTMLIHQPTGHSNSNPMTEPTTRNHTNKAPESARTDPSQAHMVVAHMGTSKSVARASRAPTLSPSSADIAQADRHFPTRVSPSGASANPTATLADPASLAMILGELCSVNARFLCLEQELSLLHHLCHNVYMLGRCLGEDMPLLQVNITTIKDQLRHFSSQADIGVNAYKAYMMLTDDYIADHAQFRAAHADLKEMIQPGWCLERFHNVCLVTLLSYGPYLANASASSRGLVRSTHSGVSCDAHG
jgi:hypothetical protein